MDVQILYATMTGHSKKIAHAIAKQLGTEAYDLKKKPQIPACDLLLIVSGIYGGEVNAELLDFSSKLSPEHIKKVALLTSSTKNIAQGSLRKTLTDAGHRVDPKEFICQGSFLFKAMGHPNRDEIADALKFVENQIQGEKSSH